MHGGRRRPSVHVAQLLRDDARRPVGVTTTRARKSERSVGTAPRFPRVEGAVSIHRAPLAVLNGDNSRAQVQNVREDSSPGFLAAVIVQYVPHVQYTILDVSAAMHEIARQVGHASEFGL